ncbi:bifunctional NAD(P)/FAD-dependent oxidoreductase/class I SAM-dependent methyltransferase [Streptomyces beijiangensis]|uniref:NAD(P)/FAD-dependent oxidoreductase n=1 Tax=Streptomyces beijiangensis TaxID=163361 RepID=A0A939JH89_9ACTN|nr:bifunctional NAD(P)/FAD-dependent oxidoreductase/class I SAM-dependent methyltransferase [Streptomyces beijiangensis]MBO0514218.1 NAD(P)/FAD-dependent oxidoreductase [Streptomyces beijiangensis]
MTSQTEQTQYDVVVIGGGAAGLSGALALGRARRSVLVIDAGQPRNAPAAHVHTYLTREGMAPAELLAEGRREVASYGGQFTAGTVTSAEHLPGGGFHVSLDDGRSYAASRLLVTTGLTDELPEVPGLAGRWGREVLHCPYCHGWEVRDQAIGILATGPIAFHLAQLWRQWSSDITLFLHTAPTPDDEEYEQLAARGITVVAGEVTAVEVADDRLTGVTTADGRTVPVQALVVTPRFTARSGLLAGLGLRPTELERDGQVLGSYIAADPTGATEVAGIWVAGNVTNLVDQVIGAAGAGVRAGAAINADLIEEETRLAVDAHRRAVGGVAFWDARYAESNRIWSGNPNVALVQEVAGLEPGRALDLGCGEGADAIWLARQGWQVTATDISAVALERAVAHAKESAVADRVDFQRHDLTDSFPEGVFDLVSAQFLHSMGEFPREEILRRAAAAVAPGGTLLIEGHSGLPHWEKDPHPGVHLPTPDEVLASLSLPEGAWEVLVSTEHERIQNDPEGTPTTRTDNTLKLRRIKAG